jgi:D-ribose pyranose/furanose isomerase RbsD
MNAGQEKLRKHIKGVRTNMKTERSVIPDEIKTAEGAARNDVEDKLEKNISALSVGQEELENRSLNQDRGQTGR